MRCQPMTNVAEKVIVLAWLRPDALSRRGRARDPARARSLWCGLLRWALVRGGLLPPAHGAADVPARPGAAGRALRRAIHPPRRLRQPGLCRPFARDRA